MNYTMVEYGETTNGRNTSQIQLVVWVNKFRSITLENYYNTYMNKNGEQMMRQNVLRHTS